jgi:hypothetical protein
VARDGECSFPTCQVPARRSDLDHVIPYPDGPTADHNLEPAHRRHHNTKTHGGWRVQLDLKNHQTIWTSPQGRTYRKRPPQRWTHPTDQPAPPRKPKPNPKQQPQQPDDDCPF